MSPPDSAEALDTLLAGARALADHAPYPRVLLAPAAWERLAGELAAGTLDLLAFFGEAGAVHAVVRAPGSGRIAVLSLACPEGRFPSLGRVHAPAIRLERAIRDLHGLVPEGAADARPWLDHGRWPGSAGPVAYPFLAAEGDNLHQIPVGPVHAGIIEPGHFRFFASGETVVRLEARLGYAHKGTEALLAGADLVRAARLVGRVSGDATVAYGIAFARAVEAALRVPPPPRADWLRALMAELERIANHLGDIGAICNDASFTLLHAHLGILRERTLQASAAAFGHRLMMDRVVPGGVAVDLAVEGAAAIGRLIRQVQAELPELIDLYDNTASLQDRTVATGIVGAALVRRFAAGGFVGRASGRAFDARRRVPYPPYDALRFDVPVLNEGDVNARVWVRIREVQASLGLLEQILAGLPGGATRHALPEGGPGAAREGLAIVESFRGDVLVWVRIGADGRVVRCHPRDPSWFQWPLLEAAVEGNIVADFPLCNKSFNCSYSGHDL
ncbi:MAG: hydrogenase expression protein HypE [Alphaproteobacteria bacterium]|nr:hydrogenase expression protein HypE [Alphaproteobacteria bacterium]